MQQRHNTATISYLGHVFCCDVNVHMLKQMHENSAMFSLKLILNKNGFNQTAVVIGGFGRHVNKVIMKKR